MIVLAYLGTFQALFVSFFFWIKKDKTLSDYIVSAFMLFLALPFVHEILRTGSLGFHFGFEGSAFHTFTLTYGTFLYLYTKTEIGEMQEFSKKQFLHFLPFLAFFIASFFAPAAFPNENSRLQPPGMGGHPPPPVLQQGTMEKGSIAGERMPPPGEILPPPGAPPFPPHRPGGPEMGRTPHRFLGPQPSLFLKITDLTIFLSFVLYTIAILRLLQRHKHSIRDYFSYESTVINLNWLRWITVFFVLAYTLVLFAFQLHQFHIWHPILSVPVAHHIAVCFFLFGFSFFAIKQPPIYPSPSQFDPDSDPEPKVSDPGIQKYSRSGLSKNDALEFKRRLEDYMQKDKPYLNGDLTLQEVSEHLQISKHYLTQVLNAELGKNFYQYINEYRIKDVIEKMKDPHQNKYPVLRLALDCGFNSKSAFNTIFKKFTQMTPSEFKESQAKTA